jgi:enoyl-CoA hydratase/carnithine racemase
MFLAIAYTIDEGRRLAFLHRYDRLGLDAEMISFGQELDAGRALELGTITPTLAAIADDTALIQRVRLKARKMLEQIAVEGH